jgi:predicted HTH transcriptional regulator
MQNWTPVIAKFFRQIGRADELGSGMRNMMKFSRAYGGADPELIEGDVFRIVIKVPESGAESGAESENDKGHIVTSNILQEEGRCD